MLSSATRHEQNRKPNQNHTPGPTPHAISAAKYHVAPGDLSAQGTGCLSCHSLVGNIPTSQHQPHSCQVRPQEPALPLVSCRTTRSKSGCSLPHADTRPLSLTCCWPDPWPAHGIPALGPWINYPCQPAVPSLMSSTAHLALLRKTFKTPATPSFPEASPSQP